MICQVTNHFDGGQITQDGEEADGIVIVGTWGTKKTLIIALTLFIGDLCRWWRLPDKNPELLNQILYNVMPLIWEKSSDWKTWLQDQKNKNKKLLDK